MPASGNRLALSVSNLCVEDGSRTRTIIKGVSLQVAQGEFVSIVGPSGSGKSTTVLSVMGLLPPSLKLVSGHGEVAGTRVDFTDSSAIAGLRGKQAGMIFQDPFTGLNPVLRCGVQAEEPLRIHTDIGRRQRRGRVLELFREVGLEDPERIYGSLPSQLSGGQVQRVMIAMAVSMEPSLLLADEPTTALDAATERSVIGLLDRLRQDRGMGVVLITHDTELATSISDRILPMREGRFISLSGQLQDKEAETGAIDYRAPAGAGVGQPVVHVSAVSKTFAQRSLAGRTRPRIQALEDVSFNIRRGETVGVVGMSGTGKTTLGRCLAGLERPDAGTVQIEDTQIWGANQSGQPSPVQLVYQNPFASLNPVMTVGEAIEEGLRSRRIAREERLEHCRRLLTQVGLPHDYLGRRPSGLSGGERQRIVIARALAAEPRVLVADEPTASLDERTGAKILTLLARLSHENGLAILLISHDIRTVVRLADRVLVLEGGRLREFI